LLDAGVARVVVGSVAAREPEWVRAWMAEFGVERLCLAFDVRAVNGGWQVAADGWIAGAGKDIAQALDAYPSADGLHVLVTDISRDGALTGPNLDLIAAIRRLRPDVRLQASGGVQSLADLQALRAAGAAAAIVGRALYERCFTLEDALAL
jgi:phosphoribosylformimino-5-aminoimidazole carboxamide ribotide isomerase